MCGAWDVVCRCVVCGGVVCGPWVLPAPVGGSFEGASRSPHTHGGSGPPASSAHIASSQPHSPVPVQHSCG